MKKIIIYAALLILISFNFANSQNTMRIDTLSGKPGDTLTYSLKVNNTAQFVAFQTDIQLPSQLSFVINSAMLTSRANGHQLGSSIISPTLIRVIAYSFTLNPFFGNEGAVLTFRCTVTGNTPGNYNLTFQSPILSDSANNNILTATYGGLFKLLLQKIGFNSGSIDFGRTLLGTNKDFNLYIYNTGTDTLTVSKLYSGTSDIKFLDSNGFTLLPGGNVMRTIRMYAVTRGFKYDTLKIRSNDPSDTLHRIPVRGEVYTINELYLSSVTCKYGYPGTIKIRMKNTEEVTAFQLSVTLPSSVTYVPGSVILDSARKNDHIITASVLSGNVLKIISYSPTNKKFSGNDSTIARFNLIPRVNPGSYSLPVSDGIISDSAGTNVLSNVYGGSISVISPVISVPSVIVFDTISYLDTNRKQLTIQNTGNDTLWISGINSTEPSFTSETLLPVRILPGTSGNFTIRFSSQIKGLHTGNLIISHSDSLRNPSSVTVRGFIYKPNRLYVTSSDFNSRDTSYIPFGINNSEQFVAFQFDVTIPPQAVFIPNSALLTSRANGHQVNSALLPNGDIRIIAYSLNMNTFTGNTGDVVKFKIAINADTGVYNVSVKNIIISDSANNNITTGSDNGFIRVNPYPPGLISPLNGSTGNPLNLNLLWRSSPFANYYHLQIATDSLFVNKIFNDSTYTDTTHSLYNLEPLTNYYWHVRIKNYSGASMFSDTWRFKTIGVPTQTVLASPANNAINQPLNITFKWYKAVDQTFKSSKEQTTNSKEHTKDLFVSNYLFELATDSVFGNIIQRDSVLTDTLKSVSGLTNITNYWWRVKAKNEIGWADYSPVWKFTTIVPLPSAPVLISPLNNSTGNQVNLNLVWTKPQYAESFNLILATDSLFSVIVLNDSLLLDSVKSITNLTPLTNYYWKVRAKNVAGWSAFSSAFKFKTIGTPTQVILSVPPNNAVNQPVNITFKWYKAVDQTLIKSKEQITNSKEQTTDLFISKYLFELATDSVFGNIVQRDSSLTDTVKSVSGLTNITNYWWRVKAKNEIGWAQYSVVWKFTTIVPLPPAPVLNSPANNSTGISLTPLLDWNDVQYASGYRIQLSADSLFGTTLWDTSSVVQSQVTVPAGKLTGLTKYYWRVNATNIAGTGSWSPVWNFRTLQNLSINLKVYLEGFWDGSSQVIDTAKIYLANSTSPFTFADSATVVLSSTGTANPTFSKTANGSYYIVVMHRNHLETWSKLPQVFITNTPVNYDFTTAADKAYGNNMKLSNGAWVLYAGDANQDGAIDAIDVGIFITQFGNLGYLSCDFNGDGSVDALDVIIFIGNFGLTKAIPTLDGKPFDERTKEQIIDEIKNKYGFLLNKGNNNL
jgi:hypothetical protein